MIFRCTVKYDAKQVNTNTKLSKILFRGFMFGSKKNYNKLCAKTRNKFFFYKNEKKREKKKKNK